MIRIDIINYGKPRVWQMRNVIYFVLFMLFFLPMIRGRSSPSYYSEIDAPIWLYLVNIGCLIIIGLLSLNNLFSDKAKVGEGKVDNKYLEVLMNKEHNKKFDWNFMNELKVEPNHFEKTYDRKTNWKIDFKYDGDIHVYDFVVDDSDKNNFESLVDSLRT